MTTTLFTQGTYIKTTETILLIIQTVYKKVFFFILNDLLMETGAQLQQSCHSSIFQYKLWFVNIRFANAASPALISFRCSYSCWGVWNLELEFRWMSLEYLRLVINFIGKKIEAQQSIGSLIAGAFSLAGSEMHQARH